ARRQGDFAVVAVATALEMEDGRVRSARIALAGVSDAPVRATEAEAMLAGATPDEVMFEEAGRSAAADLRPPSDIHGSSDYRRELAAALVRRARGGGGPGGGRPAGGGRGRGPVGCTPLASSRGRPVAPTTCPRPDCCTRRSPARRSRRH